MGLKLALDLSGVLEDTWPLKRSWLRNLGIDVLEPLGAAEIRALVGTTAHESMREAIYGSANTIDFPLFPGASDGLKHLSSLFHIQIITERRTEKRQAVHDWLRRQGVMCYLGSEPVVFVRRSQAGAKISEKVAWCREQGTDFLVDNDAGNLVGFNSAKRPHCIHYCPKPVLAEVTTVCTWGELSEFLLRRAMAG